MLNKSLKFIFANNRYRYLYDLIIIFVSSFFSLLSLYLLELLYNQSFFIYSQIFISLSNIIILSIINYYLKNNLNLSLRYLIYFFGTIFPVMFYLIFINLDFKFLIYLFILTPSILIPRIITNFSINI